MSYRAIVIDYIDGSEIDLGSFPTAKKAQEVADKYCEDEPKNRYNPIARLER